jgi:hypothetical protein
MVYLVEFPPARSQFRPRRAKPSGVVCLHTAEGTGASNVARFIRGRSDPGSYHDLVDDRQRIQLVRFTDEAFGDGTGSNPHAYHLSWATHAGLWPRMTAEVRDAHLRNGAKAAARYARWLRAVGGPVIPARRITRAQSEARVPGFISHGDRDPGRRSDPGSAFPWSRFFAMYAAEMTTTPAPAPKPPTTNRKPRMEMFWHKGAVYLLVGGQRSRHGLEPASVDGWLADGVPLRRETPNTPLLMALPTFG